MKAFRKKYADQLGLNAVDLEDTDEELDGEFTKEPPEESGGDPGDDDDS